MKISDNKHDGDAKRRVVFLDLDGTLIDSIPTLFRNYCEFLELHGRKGSEEEFKFVNGPALPEIIAHLKAAHDLPESIAELTDDYNECLARNYRDAVAPRAGACDTLAELGRRGYHISLVTSTHDSLVFPILKRLGWEHAFEHVITGESVARAKPAPDIYLLALSRAAADASETAAVEDSPNGTRAAASAGCITISLAAESSVDSLHEAGARFIIVSLAELPDLLDKIFCI